MPVAFLVLGALIAQAVGATPAAASSTFTVTSTADTGDANTADGSCADSSGRCTLRAAVEQSNASGGESLVNLPAGEYPITREIVVSGDIEIVGDGAALSTIVPTSSPYIRVFAMQQDSSLALGALAIAGTGQNHDGIATDKSGVTVSLRAATFEGLSIAVNVDTPWNAPASDVHLEVEDSVFEDNYGGAWVDANGEDLQVHVRDSTFTRTGYWGLFARGTSGAVSVTRSSIVEGEGPGLELDLTQAGEVTLREVQLLGNDDAGARIDAPEVTIAESLVATNGSVPLRVGGATTITNVTVRDNPSPYGCALDHYGGPLTMSGSTFSGNGLGPCLGTYSGDPGTAEIVNSTFSGNGYENLIIGRPDTTLRNVTITGADSGEGDEWSGLSASYDTVVVNSVIAGNEVDCNGEFVSGGNNVFGDDSCTTNSTDRAEVDAKLGPLADNGGPTWTHEPLPGSPLIDTGSDAACPVTDQREAVRPADGDGDGEAVCDVGAVEAGAGIVPGVVDIDWSGDVARRGLLRPDGIFRVTAIAQPGGSASARVFVESWFSNGDSTAGMLEEPQPAALDVVLAETSSGIYEGTAPLAGVSKVTGIGATVRHGLEGITAATSERLPVLVAGALDISAEVDAPAWSLPGARLVVENDSTGDGDSILFDAQTGNVASRWLRPGGGYRIRLQDGQGRRLAASSSEHVVRGGLRTAVSTAFSAAPYMALGVEVLDVNDNALIGAKVTVRDGTGDEIAKRIISAQEPVVAATARGAGIVVAMDPGDTPYRAMTEQIELERLDQRVVLRAQPLAPPATITGTVRGTDGIGRAGVTVTFTSVIDDRRFVFSTVSRSDGSYNAVVLQGQVGIEAREPWHGKTSGLTRDVTGDTVVDLTLESPIQGTIAVTLSTRYAGDTSPRVVDVDGPTAYHFKLYASSGRRKVLATNETRVAVDRVDDEIKVCADGREADLPSACQTVRLDAQTLRASVALDLVQHGAIRGDLALVEGGVPSRWGALVYHIGEQGRVLQRSVSQRGAAFDVGLFEPGTHEIEFTGGSEGYRAVVRVSVGDGLVVDLGTVALRPQASPFVGSVTPVEVTPGGLVQIMANFTLHPKEWCVGGISGSMSIEVPPGTSFVAGGAISDGPGLMTTPDTPVVRDGARWMVFEHDEDPPAYRPEKAGIWLRVDPEVVGSVIWVRTLETLDRCRRWVNRELTAVAVAPADGALPVVIAGLTLNVPDSVATRTVPISGRAPAGSDVVVTVDGATVAGAEASEGGFWHTTLPLPETPAPRPFVVAVETETDDGTLRTPRKRVHYDPDAPVLEKISMRQEGGRVVEWDPRVGVARFPYVVVPGQGFTVDLTFSNEDRVRDPVVHLGQVWEIAGPQPTGPEPTAGFRAHMSPSFGALGAIRVTWDIVPGPVKLGPESSGDLTLDQIRSYLVPPFDTLEDVELLEDGSEGLVRVTGAMPGAGVERVTVERTTEVEEYEPTAEDLAREADIGVAVYDFQMDWSFEGDVLSGTVRAFIPAPEQSSGQEGAGIRLGDGGGSEQAVVIGPALVPSAGAAVAGTRALTKFEIFLSPGLGDVFNGATKAWDIDSNANSGDSWSRLDAILEMANTCQDASSIADYSSAVDGLVNLLSAAAGLSASMALLGLVATPAGLFPGVISFGISLAIDKASGAYVDGQIKELESRIRNDPQCAAESVHPRNRGGKDADQEVADPSWIFDPSGYVYELFPEQRLEGVTATVQHAESADGPWTIWDAEWYGQDNPMPTDGEGRYGWFVPEGWWRVRYEKPGYLTTYSDALQVLPPHFDVNVAMTSLAAPSVSSIAARAGSGAVEVVFDNWIRTDSVVDRVAVSGPDDDPLAVTLSFPDLRATPAGDDVARTVRVEVGGELERGQSYQVTLDALIASYAGVPLGADRSSVVQVTDGVEIESSAARIEAQYSDPVAPLTVTARDGDSDSLTLTTAWRDAKGARTEGLPEGLQVSAGSCVEDGSGTRCTWRLDGTAVLPPGSYEIEVAVADEVASSSVVVPLVVAPEDALVLTEDSVPVALLGGGSASVVAIELRLREAPEASGQPGDLALANATLTLVPLGGDAISADCVRRSAVPGVEVATVVCTAVGLEPGAYTAEATVVGDYYAGSSPFVVVVLPVDLPAVPEPGSAPQAERASRAPVPEPSIAGDAETKAADRLDLPVDVSVPAVRGVS